VQRPSRKVSGFVVAEWGIGLTLVVVVCLLWQVMGQLFSRHAPHTFGEGEVRGYVYIIRSGNSDLVYVGSTTNSNLKLRLRVHEASWRSWQAGRSAYSSVFRVLEDGDTTIELLETVQGADRKVLRQREGYYYSIFKSAAVNMRNPYRRIWEKRGQQRDAARRYQRRNRVRFRDVIRESNATRLWCDPCNQWITRGNRSRHERSNKHLTNMVVNE
jgi:hypothetical protein